MIEKKKILILAPHTDDGELGCGGTICKLIDNNEVYYVAFSACQKSVPPPFDSEVLLKEVKAATSVLGIKKENLILLDYDVRTFNYRRQDILDDILKIKKQLSPDIVFMPSIHDIHQDHFTITNEGIRAFKFSSVLCYELPWNNFTFNTSWFFKLQDKHLETKCKALAEYKSQAHRPYANDDFITSLAKVRGIQSGHKYAEAFEVVRWIV
ncbi:PIG-L deacetylase family protein [Flavisolibacter ginsenosidimutans]|uniref:PIG-L family deacetylase n=1 Tax=Flavisolibacter ginsenosidimutans TaxID=661481 RepID=A0A5B8UFL3_9BACT|nr:PIG-L family deacetylase [Flavisolibacter ginsenosidimutans]QEC54890.1 PIG-L family deacetylase [Flavisolibacter ginsenosidimutans]